MGKSFFFGHVFCVIGNGIPDFKGTQSITVAPGEIACTQFFASVFINLLRKMEILIFGIVINSVHDRIASSSHCILDILDAIAFIHLKEISPGCQLKIIKTIKKSKSTSSSASPLSPVMEAPR